MEIAVEELAKYGGIRCAQDEDFRGEGNSGRFLVAYPQGNPDFCDLYFGLDGRGFALAGAVKRESGQQELRETMESATISIDEFQALEEKVLQTVDLIRKEREARAAAENAQMLAEARLEAATLALENARAEASVAQQELAAEKKELAALELEVAESSGAQAEVKSLRQETETLKQERETVRVRVEKMLATIDELL